MGRRRAARDLGNFSTVGSPASCLKGSTLQPLPLSNSLNFLQQRLSVKAPLLSPSLGALQFLPLDRQPNVPTHASSLEIFLLFPGSRNPLSFSHPDEPRFSSVLPGPSSALLAREPPLHFSPGSPQPSACWLALAQFLSVPRPSALPRAPRRSLRSASERPLRSARWGWWDGAEIAFGAQSALGSLSPNASFFAPSSALCLSNRLSV